MGSEKIVPRIPVVELSGENLKSGSDSWNSACDQIRKALENYGCFELVYNKHNLDNHNTILESIEQLFNLPDEIKRQHEISKFAHGYAGKSSLLPLYENARIDNATDIHECQSFTHLMWPHGNQSFCETVHLYAMLLAEMLELVVKMLCESYGIEKESTESLVKSSKYLLMMLKYERSGQEDTNMGLMGHRDKSFMSILHQNHVDGVELRINDGEDDHWIPFHPSSDHSSFLVFGADACMGWSNDRVKSCYHRVIVESEEVRYSVGLFSFVKGLIKVPKELVDEKHPLKYKSFEHQQYLDFYMSNTSPNKFDMDNLKDFCGI